MKFYRVVLLSLLTLSNALKHVLLENHHFINLIGPVTKNSVDAILWEWNDPTVQKNMNETQKTTLYINSPGGSVHAGSNLIQYMRALQAQNITIECIGENFMSMAFVIFQACDHRMVLENSIGMQHQMSFGLRGNIETMRTSFQMHDRINENIISMELAKIGIDRETYNTKIAHDWWIIGSDNVEQNTADELVLYSCSPEIYPMTQVRKEKVSHYTFHVFTHKCPLFKDVEVTENSYQWFYNQDLYNQFDYAAFYSSYL